jgi:DNA polymerase-3 subunit gamma/tau
MQTEIKYAPTSINDVVFTNAWTESSIKAIAKGLPVSGLLLAGSNGNGKTTIANVIANELTKHCPALHLNDTIEKFLSYADIRVTIIGLTTFYRTGCGATAKDRVVVIFNELDKFNGRLDQLWLAMDGLKDDLLVIITTNDPMSIPLPLRSRCDKYDFRRVTPAEFLSRAQFILKAEGVTLPDAATLYYLRAMTNKVSDVRDYMRVLDKLIYMTQNGIALPPVVAASTQSIPASVSAVAPGKKGGGAKLTVAK